MDNTTILLIIVLAVLFLTCNQSKETPTAQPRPPTRQENFSLDGAMDVIGKDTHEVIDTVEQGVKDVQQGVEHVLDPVYDMFFPESESTPHHLDSKTHHKTVATDGLKVEELLPSSVPTSFSENCPDLGRVAVPGSEGLDVGVTCNANSLGMVSQVSRNPNLQLRSEIPNPQIPVSVFNTSTIAPDLSRRGLEIGSESCN